MADATTRGADSRRIYTVAELNQAIQESLRVAFPEAVWVRGEIQRLPPDAARRTHVYFELHGTGTGAAAGFQIPVALLSWDRQRFGLGRYLDGSDPDLRLADKIEVCLQCQVDFYPPFGRLSLRVVGVDKEFTLGRLEAQRRAVLEELKAAGLLERNRGAPLPVLPLRIGLITSRGSAAERDFLACLAEGGHGFTVWLADCRMQGESTERQVVAALRGLVATGAEVVVITRGGGSRADLSWFDVRGIATAIALCPVPVVTAIGHEIDTSIADLVAHTSCRTPTAAARFLVDRVAAAAARVEEAVALLTAIAPARLATARGRLREGAQGVERQVTRRVQAAAGDLAGQGGRLRGAAAGHLARARARRAEEERRLARVAVLRLEAARGTIVALVPRLGAERLLSGWPRRRRELARQGESAARLAAAALQRAQGRADGLAGKARLLDPARLLARGYTLTMDGAGRLVRSSGALAPGDRLRTRFADGVADSVVESVAPAPPDPGDGPAGGAVVERSGSGE